jgi:peroxiredoxin Q/BCP
MRIGPYPGRLVALAVLSVAVTFAQAHAQDSLKVGDPAPQFECVADNGHAWRSSDHVGRKILVVYFYPVAMTGGCTKQACGFRDNRTRLNQLGAMVVGVSGDRVENLRYFKKANKLNFPLLSDTSGAAARAFGVPSGEGGTITRKVDGKDVMLTRDRTHERWTFVVGRDGRIAFIETQVNAAADGRTVTEAIERMRGK